MKEQWVEIRGYRGLYEISNLGNVRSVDRVVEMKNGVQRPIKGKMLTPTTDQYGYLKVHLSKDNEKTMFRIHQLVAKHFLDKSIDGKWFVNRHDNNLTNNRVDNLYWEKSSVSLSKAGKIGGKISKRSRKGA